MSRYVSILVAVSAFSVGQIAEGEWVQWTVAEGGNDHWYRLTTSEFTSWADLEQEAVLLGGHLVTIDDANENQWILETFCPLLGSENLWTGLYQDLDEPGCAPNCEPDQGWKWISGESVVYTNWGGGEPNNLLPPPARVPFGSSDQPVARLWATFVSEDGMYGFITFSEEGEERIKTGDLLNSRVVVVVTTKDERRCKSSEAFFWRR